MKKNEQLSNHHRAEIMNAVRAEYQALRSEISEHLKATYIIATALATMLAGALTVGSITWQAHAIVSALIFNVAVPMLLLTAAIGMVYAIREMESIGKYIKSEVEDKIDFLFDSDFQEWLKEKRLETGLKRSWRIMDWEGHVEQIRRVSKLGRQYDTLVFVLVFGIPFLLSFAMGTLRISMSDGWLSTQCFVRWLLALSPFVIASAGVIGCTLLKRSGASKAPRKPDSTKDNTQTNPPQ